MLKISHIDIQLLSFRNSGPVQPYKGKNMAKTMPICPLITKTTKAAKLIPRYAIISGMYNQSIQTTQKHSTKESII